MNSLFQPRTGTALACVTLVLLALGVTDSQARERRTLPQAGSPAAMMTRGKLEGDLGRLDEAAATFTSLADDDSAPSELRYEALLRLGIVLQRTGQLEDSVLAFERVVTDYGHDAEALRQLTHILSGVEPNPTTWDMSSSPVSFVRESTEVGPSLAVVWPEIEFPTASRQLQRPFLAGTGAGPVHGTGQPISLEFKAANLHDLLRLFAEITDMNILVPSGVANGSVTMRVNDRPWDEVLDLLLKSQGLVAHVNDGVMMIETPSAMARTSLIDTGLDVPFDAPKADFQIVDEALSDVLMNLAEASDVDLRLHPEAENDARVTLAVSDVRADKVLDLVMRTHGLAGQVENGFLVVRPFTSLLTADGGLRLRQVPDQPAAGTISMSGAPGHTGRSETVATGLAVPFQAPVSDFAFDDESLGEVLSALAAAADIDFSLGQGIDIHQRVTMQATEVRADLVLDKVMRAYNLGGRVEDGVLILRPAAETRAEGIGER